MGAGAARIRQLRQPEVQHLDGPIVADFDIRRLQIAVNDAQCVRGFNRFCNLSRDRERLWKRNRTSRDPVRQRRTVHQFHHERMGPARIFEAVDPRDMRMVQRRKNLGLSVETGKPLRISRDEVRQNFERHVTIELRVPRAIDLAHTARAEGGEDLVWAKARAGLEGHGDLTGLYLSGFKHLRESAGGSVTKGCEGFSIPSGHTGESMITILGAGGAIGNELVKLLAAKNQPFRLVGRNPKATPGRPKPSRPI